MRLSGLLASQAGGGRSDGPGGFWRRAVSAAADAAAVCPVLRTGGRRPGAEPPDRQHIAPGQRHFLHGCKRKSSAGGVGRGVSAGDRCFSGRRPPRCPGRAAGGAALHWRPLHRVDSPMGQWKRTAGPYGRAAGAGDGAGEPGCRSAGGSPAAVDAGAAAVPGGPAGASAPGGPGTAAPSDSVPRGRHLHRAAAGGADRLGGDLRNTPSGCDGGAVPHDTGNGICGPLGRRCEKRRRS